MTMSSPTLVKWRRSNALRQQMMGEEISNLSKAILAVTGLHDHTEFQFSKRYDHISYSATMREGLNCARFKQIGYSHPLNWDTTSMWMTEAQEDRCYAEAVKYEGTPYDKIGVLSLSTRLNIIQPREDKVWCNEVCGYILNAGFLYNVFDLIGKRPDQIHPTEADMVVRTLQAVA